MIRISLGNYIKESRLSAGLTQRQLGEACGYEGRAAEVTVQHWEHDRQKPPLDCLRRLAVALGVPLDSLIP